VSLVLDVVLSSKNVDAPKKDVENNQESQNNNPGQLCLTPGCIQAGKNLNFFS